MKTRKEFAVIGLVTCAMSSVLAPAALGADKPVQPTIPPQAIRGNPAQPADVWQAINANSLPLVQRYVTDPNAVDPLGQPALLLAASRGYADIAAWLLERGAAVDIRGPRNWTPLIAATYGGHTDLVELLLKHHADKTAVSADGLNALFYAIDYRYADIIDVLLAAGADANAATSPQFQDGHSPLMRAAMRNAAPIASQLMAGGAHVEQRDAQGRTALFYAAEYNALDVLAVLQRARVDVKARDSRGDTALQAMAEKGPAAIARQLLAMGVDATADNKAGDTALIIAARAGNTDVAQLLAEKSDKAARGTALFAAVEGGALPTVTTLLQLGVPVDSRDRNGATPLMIAARHSHAHLVDYLLQRGANPKLRDRKGDDALLQALENPPVHVGMAEQLIGAGADMNASNRDGRSALQLMAASTDTALQALSGDKR